MKHFIGGWAVGLIIALRLIPATKKATSMSNYEFSIYIFAPALIASLFGLAAYGLLP